ncbi:uncharacterized protein LOC34619859 [Cyclospora cayetanensis]|uniref:Uncharacterized protein LOC34619859 n=1 Tax=Cyclospora cayetanensis TaxID=88456 RepID=A0A6P6RQK6_9EIME|nr:uncharacterized protein LOC34619859 [Cyclospora cayetanensis]
MQQQEEAAGNAPWGSLGGLAMRLTIGVAGALAASGWLHAEVLQQLQLFETQDYDSSRVCGCGGHSPYLHCAAPTLTAVAAPAPAVSQQPPPLPLPSRLVPLPYTPLPLLRLLNATQLPEEAATGAAAGAAVADEGAQAWLQPGSAPFQEVVARLLMCTECLYSPSGFALCSSEQKQQQLLLQQLQLPLTLGTWSTRDVIDTPTLEGDFIRVQTPPPLLPWWHADSAAVKTAFGAAAGEGASATRAGFNAESFAGTDADGTVYIIASSADMCSLTGRLDASRCIATAPAAAAPVEGCGVKTESPSCFSALLERSAAAAVVVAAVIAKTAQLLAASCCSLLEPLRPSVPSVGWQISRDVSHPSGRCIVTCVITVASPPPKEFVRAAAARAAADAAAALTPFFEGSRKTPQAADAAKRFAASAVACVLTAGAFELWQPETPRQRFLPWLMLAGMAASRRTALAASVCLSFVRHLFVLNKVLSAQGRIQQSTLQRMFWEACHAGSTCVHAAAF